jgi:hypothetical protein
MCDREKERRESTESVCTRVRDKEREKDERQEEERDMRESCK